jgi:hypothetical protein
LITGIDVLANSPENGGCDAGRNDNGAENGAGKLDRELSMLSIVNAIQQGDQGRIPVKL